MTTQNSSYPDVRERRFAEAGREEAVVHPADHVSRVAYPAEAVVHPADRAEAAGHLWGWLPGVSLAQAGGVLLIALANNMARMGQSGSSLLFWLGLLVIVMPATVRLLSPQIERRERLGLVVALALAFYLVKVVHSPVGLTFSDEFVHLANVEAIRDTGHLFNSNSILPVTPLYPGLPIVTSAVAGISGLSDFSAALIVMGIGRVLLLLSIYLLVEATIGSAQVAGLATVLYTTNTNFLYWTAQFAYESLALPLAGIVLYAVISKARRPEEPRGLSVTAALLIAAVIVTHHLTSYGLVAFLLLAAVIFPLVTRRAGPWKVALFALLGVALWLGGVASMTVGYLEPVLSRAIGSVLDLLSGEGGRTLFAPSSPVPGMQETAAWERVVALGSVPLIVMGVLTGLWLVWRYYRHRPYAVLLGLVGLTYLPVQGLRLTQAGWETANRSSEFLFLGVAFLLALMVRQWWANRDEPSLMQQTTALGYIGLLFLAGVIAGWQPALRTGRPYQVAAGERILETQGMTAARWSETYLGEGNVMISDQANARLMLAYGEQSSYTGRVHGIQDFFFATDLGEGEREVLDVVSADYAVYDERLVSWDNMLGIYFERLPGDIPAAGRRLSADSERKFDETDGVDRIFDSGLITIFDVREVPDANREP